MTAIGAMPQATHTGELMPATAMRRDGRGPRLPEREQAPEQQRRIGGQGDLHVAGGSAVGWVPKLPLEPVASASVAKNDGRSTVLVSRPVVWPIRLAPKL